jgi:ABC-2 type transport system ATP-binding protein
LTTNQSSGFLEVRGLRKAYGATVAVDGLNLSISRGVCYGLLGPNGAGKSTTIGILAGNLNADAGDALLDGQPIRVENLSLKERIGYVPQDLALYEDLTALDNMRFFAMLYGIQGANLQRRVEFGFEVSGLTDRKKELVRNLSGGMKRRLNIAGALLHDPDLLILDEPTVGVDPQSRNLIFESLERLVSEGKTLLYTTHYMEEVERLCKRVAIMDGGRVISEGEIGELHSQVPSRRVVRVKLERGLSRALKPLPGLVNFQEDSLTLSFEPDNLTRDLPIALAAIAECGGIIEDVRTERPSLEEVFLHLTGRSLRE